MPSFKSPIAILAGVGSGTGRSCALRFAKHYPVVLLARNPANYEPIVKEIEQAGGQAIGISTDASSEESMLAAFKQINALSDEGTVRVAAAVYNVGGQFFRKPVEELTVDEFTSGYQTNGLGAFLFARAVIPNLKKQVDIALKEKTHSPTLIFTGATASLRGGPQMSAFATGKFALRALTQSLGKELGPQGIHVAHAIIDGIIDIERTKGWKVDHPDGKISPDAIAEQYWFLHTQPRSAFTNEVDIRPCVEKW